MSGPASRAHGQGLASRRHAIGLEWVDELGGVPLEFQPGSQWAYSALAGSDVLSRIVEIVTERAFDEYVREQIFEPLAMGDTFFWPSRAQRRRLVTSYERTDSGLVLRTNPDSMCGERYFSGAGGLISTAEDYARFAMMLANRGVLDGARLLSPRSVEFLSAAHIPDTLAGRRSGEGFGLSVRVIDDPIRRGTMLSRGSFGWSSAYGTHFWVDPVQELVAILMIQSPIRSMRPDFETMVMQAVVD